MKKLQQGAGVRNEEGEERECLGQGGKKTTLRKGGALKRPGTKPSQQRGSRTPSQRRTQGHMTWGPWDAISWLPAIPQVRRSSAAEFTSPLQHAIIFLYFQFASQAGEKWITSPWVSLFRTIKKSYFLVTRRMTTPRFPIFSPQEGCHHSVLIDPTFHP